MICVSAPSSCFCHFWLKNHTHHSNARTNSFWVIRPISMCIRACARLDIVASCAKKNGWFICVFVVRFITHWIKYSTFLIDTMSSLPHTANKYGQGTWNKLVSFFLNSTEKWIIKSQYENWLATLITSNWIHSWNKREWLFRIIYNFSGCDIFFLQLSLICHWNFFSVKQCNVICIYGFERLLKTNAGIHHKICPK